MAGTVELLTPENLSELEVESVDVNAKIVYDGDYETGKPSSVGFQLCQNGIWYSIDWQNIRFYAAGERTASTNYSIPKNQSYQWRVYINYSDGGSQLDVESETWSFTTFLGMTGSIFGIGSMTGEAARNPDKATLPHPENSMTWVSEALKKLEWSHS